MAIRIVTDSASDLPVKVREQYPEVVVIPLMVVTDEGKELADGIDITTLEVCDAMRAGKVYKTSQVTPERFEEVFKSCVQNGDSVVYVGFSSELSGTVQSARLAVNMIKEEMPEADITVIDTLCASYGFGMVVQRAAELARQGVEKDTLVELVTFYAKHQQHVFSVDNLEYLRRGGRVSNVAAFFGGMLNIKPVLDVEEGKLIPVYARDVIWACGGIGGIYDNSTNFPHLTGDALAIAIHRNVALKNVNYVQIHPTTLYSQKKGRRFLISESVRGEGAVLLDKNGERFTNELQPRDVVSREIHRQMEKDHTKHVWLSLKTIPLDVKERFPNIYQKCLEEGYDITKEPIPVVPAQHYFMGGVKVDSNSETTMDHLYAAGETSCNGVHGANRLASNSLLESLVFAERAAKKMAAEWAAEGLVENADRKETATEPKEDEWKLLAKRYDIRKEDYQNMKEYAERCKESIWDAIRKEDEYESNHKNTKCG